MAIQKAKKNHSDPASDVAREGVQQAIEDIVTAFTEAKLAQLTKFYQKRSRQRGSVKPSRMMDWLASFSDSYQGQREDKPAKQVVRSIPHAPRR